MAGFIYVVGIGPGKEDGITKRQKKYFSSRIL